MEMGLKERDFGPVPALVFMSWVGMVVHNRVELPGLSYSRPEYVVPTLISLGLTVAWWIDIGRRRKWIWALLVWAGAHFVIGAILSVLPLPIWPFTPEQSLRHYFSHVIYGLFQIPLIWKLASELRSGKEWSE
jgi:hypothetical protein